jgi:hypothetical protein
MPARDARRGGGDEDARAGDSATQLGLEHDAADRDQVDPFLPGALRYAGIVFPVFPLRPRDKVPLIPRDRGGRGCLDATTDPDQIREWWTSWPNANIGLACGTAVWVLDVDGEEGLSTLTDLEDLHRWLPEGPASVTGTGGMHLLFAGNDRVRNSVKRLGPGLDTRATGGYIVGPPSVHPNGNPYRWLPGRDPWSVPLPEAPAWLLDLLDSPQPSRPAAPKVRPRPSSTPYVAKAFERELEAVALAGDGQRNSTLNRAAFSLGRFVAKGELDAVDVGDALVDAALAAGLNRHEATRTVMSGLRAAVGRAS